LTIDSVPPCSADSAVKNFYSRERGHAGVESPLLHDPGVVRWRGAGGGALFPAGRQRVARGPAGIRSRGGHRPPQGPPAVTLITDRERSNSPMGWRNSATG